FWALVVGVVVFGDHLHGIHSLFGARGGLAPGGDLRRRGPRTLGRGPRPGSVWTHGRLDDRQCRTHVRPSGQLALASAAGVAERAGWFASVWTDRDFGRSDDGGVLADAAGDPQS